MVGLYVYTVYYFIILCVVKISIIIFLILRNSGSVGSVEQLIKSPLPPKVFRDFSRELIFSNEKIQLFWGNVEMKEKLALH